MINELRKLEEMGYVRSSAHLDLPLLVWNYTPAAQYQNVFGDYPLLRKCRGLITDLDGNVKLTGYMKFLNWEQHHLSELPLGSKNYTIETKLDGSLLIVGRVYDKVIYSTRGSFYSSQSALGEKLFKELYNEDWIEEGYSYLFELIGPSNRIVNRYAVDDLILHGLIDTKTGLDAVSIYPFKQVEKHEVEGAVFSEELYSMLSSLNTANEEGFVLKVREPGVPTWMCKIKFSDYCRLHSIVTKISNRDVWEYLRDNRSFDEIIEICPDEFNTWLKQTKHNLENEYEIILAKAKIVFGMIQKIDSRRDQALELISNHKDVSHIVFNMLDGKSYTEIIWDMVKPRKFVQPFSNKDED
jgi:RNA ligase